MMIHHKNKEKLLKNRKIQIYQVQFQKSKKNNMNKNNKNKDGIISLTILIFSYLVHIIMKIKQKENHKIGC